ncbi:bifunctional inhibitor/lipid-transfer protein/seed storage 2S albumin superfamily protein [Artemisia annua]|uniref:Bifunctional inhibitor/lipid-transfer protein/seed storage 2S albumin superfamily protein n=1 Tax=Artemisia annua TaxID=35608 RepID=A0A2U1KGP5_ARTAN|nr:bifunctional inhibitor/lipid-transfer protein/seed storage 2S albumin superfamily protein [Artemisia annua]
MAISITRFTFFTLLMCSFAMILSNKVVSAQCSGDMQGLMEQCARYVQKSGPQIPPSTSCCAVVKNVDLACVCSHITNEVEGIVSMEKAAFIAQACGKPLIHGTHCGSKILDNSLLV